MPTLENRLYLDPEGNSTGQTSASPIEMSQDIIPTGDSSQISDLGYVPVSTSSLSSGSLKEEPTINYQAYQEPSIYDVSKMDYTPVLGMTEPEKQADTFSSQLMELQEGLLGESAYRTQLEEKRGMSDLIQTQSDLTAQLKALKNESMAIPLQVQQESEGRGRTAGGVAPIEASRLRKNAIQALTVNAMLEATNGNITTAQTLIDRAVAQKYDPIREQIAVKTKNLELIRNSEAYSAADRERAQKQLDIQNAILKQTEKAEANEKEVLSIAAEAAKFGVDSVTLDKIRKAKDVVEATSLAQAAGVYAVAEKAKEDFTLSEGQKRYDAQGNLIADNPKQAEELTEMEKLNIESKKLDIQQKLKDLEGTGQLSSGLVSQIDRISTSFDNSPIVKNFNEVQNKKLSIDAIVDNGVGGPADLALVFEFMKALDPTSVVRESEYDTASKAGNIFKGWAAKFNGYLKAEGGFLPEEVKNEFKRITNDKFDIIRRQYSNLRDEKARLVNQKTGSDNGLDYLIDYDFTAKPENQGFKTINDFLLKASDEQLDAADTLKQTYPFLTDDDLLELINEQLSFNKVGGDTNQALPKEAATVKEGEKGGQCGRFVNNATGLGLGDSYESKLAKMDKSITKPEPGMVFVMPYGSTGHTGFVLEVRGDKVLVKDSNYSLDEKVKIHEIPISKITGLRRINNNLA